MFSFHARLNKTCTFYVRCKKIPDIWGATCLLYRNMHSLNFLTLNLVHWKKTDCSSSRQIFFCIKTSFYLFTSKLNYTQTLLFQKSLFFGILNFQKLGKHFQSIEEFLKIEQYIYGYSNPMHERSETHWTRLKTIKQQLLPLLSMRRTAYYHKCIEHIELGKLHPSHRLPLRRRICRIVFMYRFLMW